MRRWPLAVGSTLAIVLFAATVGSLGQARFRIPLLLPLLILVAHAFEWSAIVQTAVRGGRVVRRDGFFATIWNVAARLSRRVYRLDEVLIYRIGDPAQPADGRKASPPGLHVAKASTEQLKTLADTFPDVFSEESQPRFQQRLEHGDVAYVATIDGRIAHVAWMGTRSTLVTAEAGPKCCVRFTDDIAVIFDCWTPRAFRGRGIYPLVIERLAAQARSRGADALNILS